jgi:hypothetical protein
MNKFKNCKINPSLMKSMKYNLLRATVIILIFTSCTKEDKVTPTALEIRLIDELGNSVTGANVKLYKSSADMQNNTNQFSTTQISDASGKVIFSNLTAVTYYWFAEKGCQNNVNGISTTAALELNKTKVVTSTLSGTGTLELSNQSTNSYEVYINGYYLLMVSGGLQYRYFFVPEGSYYIEVQQENGTGYKDYTGSITCGNTLTITFP